MKLAKNQKTNIHKAPFGASLNLLARGCAIQTRTVQTKPATRAAQTGENRAFPSTKFAGKSELAKKRRIVFNAQKNINGRNFFIFFTPPSIFRITAVLPFVNGDNLHNLKENVTLWVMKESRQPEVSSNADKNAQQTLFEELHSSDPNLNLLVTSLETIALSYGALSNTESMIFERWRSLTFNGTRPNNARTPGSLAWDLQRRLDRWIDDIQSIGEDGGASIEISCGVGSLLSIQVTSTNVNLTYSP